MNLLFAAALYVQEFLEARQWRYCFIGGLAVLRWGEMRATGDIDLLVLTGIGNDEHFIDGLIDRFRSRVADPAEFALSNRVILLTTASGVPVDLSMGGIPFEASVVARARRHDFAPGVGLQICSAEDLVVLKAFADRLQDWRDIEGVLLRTAAQIDWEYVPVQLEPLCALKESPEILRRLEELRRRCR